MYISHKLSITCNEVVHQRCRDAEDPHQQVTDSQVEDEEVGDRAHTMVFQYDETHQDVTHHTQQKDEGVSQGVDGSHIQRVLIVREKGNVGDIGYTI